MHVETFEGSGEENGGRGRDEQNYNSF